MGRKARYIPRQAGRPQHHQVAGLTSRALAYCFLSLSLSLALPIYLQLMYNQTGCACILTENYFVHLKLLMKLCVCAHLYMSCVILFSLRVFRYHCRMRKLQLYRFIDLYYCVIIHTQRQRHNCWQLSRSVSWQKYDSSVSAADTHTHTYLLLTSAYTHTQAKSWAEMSPALHVRICTYIGIFIHDTELHNVCGIWDVHTIHMCIV